MSAYDWERGTTVGQGVERRLDQAIAKHYLIREVDQALREFGIDRIITNKRNRVSFSAEYKYDVAGWATGHAFMETTSVVGGEARMGWVKGFMAQVVIYADYGTGIAHFLRGVDIKRLDFSTYPEATMQGAGRRSLGHTVPLAELAAMAFGRLRFDRETYGPPGTEP